MKLQKIGLSAEQFHGIPMPERSLIVVLGHALNEINTLNKLLFMSTRFTPEPTLVSDAQAAQAFILARPLVGKLNEAWKVIQTGYFGSKLSMRYQELLEPSATDSLSFLKSYFGRKNLVNEVRNSFAFHYALDHGKTKIPDDSPPESLAIYLHKSPGNSLYYFAEYLMTKALVDAISPGDPAVALGKLLDEMVAVIRHLNELVQGLLFVILDKYVGEEVLRRSVETVQLGNVANVASIHIPFFVELGPI